MSYEYDIFVSYTRAGVAGDWVRNYFHGELRGWLEETMETPPRIFWDRDIETGQNWPQKLQDALARSRFLVPVFTHTYFRSQWCMSEFDTMAARCEDAGDAALIFPVRFHGDRAQFPERARSIQDTDMRDWAYTTRGFADTSKYLDFVDAVKALCQAIAAAVPHAPAWSADWPTLQVTPTAPAPMVVVPRL